MKNMSLWFKRAFVAMALIGTLMAITGCRNTAHGMGEDMERAGEAVQDRTD